MHAYRKLTKHPSCPILPKTEPTWNRLKKERPLTGIMPLFQCWEMGSSLGFLIQTLTSGKAACNLIRLLLRPDGGGMSCQVPRRGDQRVDPGRRPSEERMLTKGHFHRLNGVKFTVLAQQHMAQRRQEPVRVAPAVQIVGN